MTRREEMTLERRQEMLATFAFPFVREKLHAEGNWTTEDLDVVEGAFRRFMGLVLLEDGPIAMINRRVDDFWHTFILFTPQYNEFCERVMGFFVHHQPRTSTTPVPERAIANFVTAYKRHFGQLEPFWLEQIDPAIRPRIEMGQVPLSVTFDWSGWTERPPTPAADVL